MFKLPGVLAGFNSLLSQATCFFITDYQEKRWRGREWRLLVIFVVFTCSALTCSHDDLESQNAAVMLQTSTSPPTPRDPQEAPAEDNPPALASFITRLFPLACHIPKNFSLADFLSSGYAVRQIIFLYKGFR